MIIINDATRLLVPLQVDRARPAKKLTTMLIATGKSELHCPKSSAMPALPVKVSSRVFQLLFLGTLYWRFIVKVVLFIRSTKCPFYCAVPQQKKRTRSSSGQMSLSSPHSSDGIVRKRRDTARRHHLEKKNLTKRNSTKLELDCTSQITIKRNISSSSCCSEVIFVFLPALPFVFTWRSTSSGPYSSDGSTV